MGVSAMEESSSNPSIYNGIRRRRTSRPIERHTIKPAIRSNQKRFKMATAQRNSTVPRASYLGVFLTFARNSLVRNMMFRANFIIECLSSVTWTLMNLGFYLLIFRYTNSLGENTGWGQWEFFAFLATTMLVNSLVQAFFMPNFEDISELIRTSGLDFVILKPI